MKISAKNLLLSAMLCTPLIASAQVCEVWTIDGQDATGNVSAAWNFNHGANPGTMTGNGHMRSGSGEVSYFDISARVSESSVYAETVNSSNKAVCDFTGQYFADDQAAGFYTCTSDVGKVYKWAAKIDACQKK